MINYILQIILFQVFFLAFYDFFLSKETFFTKNRWYLLATPILSFVLPLIKIPTFQKAVPKEYIVQLPEIFLSPEKVLKKTAMYQSVSELRYINVLFGIGVVLFSILFLIKFFKIISLIRKNEIVQKQSYKLVLLPKQTKAFSFFNFIFLGKEIPLSQQSQIIAHELVHSKQKHSFDLLFFEFLKIVMWFNPMIYFYQKRITLLHEYISDEVAAKSETKETYINNLLSNFFQVENIAFVNQFYKKTLIKKRIIMMKKAQSKKMNQLKYLVMLPVLASMLFYTSCSDTVKERKTEMELLKSENQKLRDSLKAVHRKLEVTSGQSKKIINNKLPEIYSDGSVSFMTVDKAPVFPGCKSGDKACFSKEVQKHFSRNFNADLPNQLGLKAGKKRVFIGFWIDAEGNVVNVDARAPHADLKAEVIRVMKTLPKMMPGEQSGKKVVVKYSLPLTIIVE